MNSNPNNIDINEVRMINPNISADRRINPNIRADSQSIKIHSNINCGIVKQLNRICMIHKQKNNIKSERLIIILID